MKMTAKDEDGDLTAGINGIQSREKYIALQIMLEIKLLNAGVLPKPMKCCVARPSNAHGRQTLGCFWLGNSGWRDGGFYTRWKTAINR